MNAITTFKEKLDSVSPSFCVAKWKQVTLHLATGHTHSCHHPRSHHIPLNEIKIDVSALHNTEYKKEQRSKMLQGIRPIECDYCWKIEDSNAISDRILKSSEDWAAPYLEEIVENKKLIVDPSYLEVSFSNVCNFKCSYCSPEVSSKWMEEINAYGAYQTSKNYNSIEVLKQQQRIPIPERENNPYIDAFWQWFPKLHKSLKFLRITGGEPLLSKHTFTLLDYLNQNPNRELNLNINSNLCVPDELFNKFINLVQTLLDKKCIKSFKMFTSCEATSKKAEYIRHGLNYDLWLSNCYRLLKTIKQSKLTVISTYNVLSVTSFVDLLQHVYDLKVQFSSEDPSRVGIDIPYLRYPTHLSVAILPQEYLSHIEDQITFMYKHMQDIKWFKLNKFGYSEYEINRMKKNYHVFKTDLKNNIDVSTDRMDFAIFIAEHDRRRGTNFIETFPEFEDFLELCKNATSCNRKR